MRALFIVWIAATIAGVLAIVGGIYTLVAGCCEITFSWQRIGGRSGLLGLVCLDGPAEPWETSFSGTFGGVGLIILGCVLLLPTVFAVLASVAEGAGLSAQGDAPKEKSPERRFPVDAGVVPANVLSNKIARKVLEYYWLRVDHFYWALPADFRTPPSGGTEGGSDLDRDEWWDRRRADHQRLWTEMRSDHSWASSGVWAALGKWSDNNWTRTEAAARALFCYRFALPADQASRLALRTK